MDMYMHAVLIVILNYQLMIGLKLRLDIKNHSQGIKVNSFDHCLYLKLFNPTPWANLPVKTQLKQLISGYKVRVLYCANRLNINASKGHFN